MTPGAIVVGAHANGLGVIRTLGRRGIRVVSVSTRPFDFAQHSRFVAERHALPRFHEAPEMLLELLEQHAQRWSGAVVLPTNDDALATLARNHERLSRWYRLPVQPWPDMVQLLDKDRMHALAAGAGIELPACLGPATSGIAARTDLTFPLVVKPLQHDRLISLYGAKLFLANDAAELRAAIARLEAARLEGLVYEFVPGPDRLLHVYCVYLDRHGEPSPGITVRKLRQHPPRIGGARVVQPVPDQPGLRDATVALLRRAGFRGMAFAEFKHDPRDGRFRFIEVNGRAVLFNGVMPPTGLDLVAMTWADFGLGEPLRPALTGWRGTWIHLQAEFLCAVKYRRSERLALHELLAPYRGAVTFGDWSAADPLPFFAQTALAGRGALRSLRRRRSGPDADPLPAEATPRT